MPEEINPGTPPVETPPVTPPAETPPTPEPSPVPTPPNEETPPAETPPATDPPKDDINYAEELTKLEANVAPIEVKVSTRSEEEKAKFTIDKIHERFPNLKEAGEATQTNDESVNTMHRSLLRNQVEGIIRADSKSDDEVKYKMHFYDKRIQQTGNIHDDADNAQWLANKNRTRNAIEEQKRDPGDPGSGNGAGQKTPTGMAPDLPAEEHARLIQAGLKKVAQGHYEGEKVIIKWDVQAQQWDQKMK